MARGEGTEAKGAPSKPEPAPHPVTEIEGVGEKTAEILMANGFMTVQDVVKADVEKLASLPGIGEKKAEKLLHSARQAVEEGKK